MENKEAFLHAVREQAERAASELLDLAKLEEGDLFVVGCSSSEVSGSRIGTDSSPEVAQAIVDGLYPVLERRGVFLAAQCCEHLNRAIIVEKQYAKENRIPVVNVVPQLKAGGSFATACYKHFKEPVAVEGIQAAAGMDIGDTLIGMHLRPVAVPVRGSIGEIGHAHVCMARTRAKYIGGERAVYKKQ